MKDEASSAVVMMDEPPAHPPLSWRRRFWRSITLPWFSSLLEQPVMCRVLLASVSLLGGAYLMGWSLWPCMFAKTTGLPCPGCGMTRATAALLKGQWGLAMTYHPFSPGFMVMGLLIAWAAVTPEMWRRPVVRWVKAAEMRSGVTTLFLLTVLIYGLLRMAGLCTSPPIVSPSPVRPWLQERMEGRN